MSFVVPIRWAYADSRQCCGSPGGGGVTDPTSGFFAANARAVRFLAAHDAPNYPEVDAV